MSTVGGTISILDWLKDKLPIQGRVERWKNERENLLKEEATLKKGTCDAKKSARLDYVVKRLDYLDQLLRNRV